MFFKRKINIEKVIVKLKIVPNSNKECVSVSYGCNRFIDSYRFLSDSLDKLIKNLDEDDFKI